MAESEAMPGGEEEVLKPEAAEAAIGIISDFYSDLYEVAESAERAATATIAYVDRMIILAGGTLTLIFTVVGSISGHLATNHQSAVHPSLIIVACWLLVSSILSGLICSSSLIKRQHQAATGATLGRAETKMRLRILGKIATTKPEELEKIPRLQREFLDRAEKASGRVAKVSGVVAQVSLFSAFLFLTLFIQVNISLLLNAAK